jgi:hypothetical protein
MKQASRFVVVSVLTIGAGMMLVSGSTAAGHAIQGLNARVVALNIPGASAIAQIGDFLNVPPPDACANPIPSKFPDSIKPGAVLDPLRLLVGSRSNFGRRAPRLGGGHSCRSTQRDGIRSFANFASGDQASTLGGVQMFSANSPHWFNGVNNPGRTLILGSASPGLSNNAFGQIWPANAVWRRRRRLVLSSIRLGFCSLAPQTRSSAFTPERTNRAK